MQTGTAELLEESTQAVKWWRAALKFGSVSEQVDPSSVIFNVHIWIICVSLLHHHICIFISNKVATELYNSNMSAMRRAALASPSPTPFNEIDNSFLEQQRQRESSAGAFDHSNEDPVIVEINSDRLRDKLCQLEAGLLPSRLMTADELYYQAKDPHLWPWERSAVLTPTPPDTPTSTSNTEMEESSSYCVKGDDEEKADMQRRARIQLGCSTKHTPQKRKRPSYPPRLRHPPSSRKKQSNKKRINGGIRKGLPVRKHSMITRSRCRGTGAANYRALR